MDLFDDKSGDGLSVLGIAGLILAFGIGAYFLWETAYQRGANSVIRLDAPGCVMKTADGNLVTVAPLQNREHRSMVPKDVTLTAACVNPM